MKKEIIRKLTTEQYLDSLICFCAGLSVLVLGLMIKKAYIIDLSSMNVF